MALSIKNIKRSFVLENNGSKIDLPDFNPDCSPEEIQNFYSGAYPELTTSSVHGPELIDDVAVYSFKTTVGTKG